MFIETARGRTYLVCRCNDFSVPRCVTTRWPLTWAEGAVADGPAAKLAPTDPTEVSVIR